MSYLTTKVIQTEQGQAILIPDEYRTKEKEILISKYGDVFTICPVKDPWLPFKQVVGTVPDNFMEDREQPMLNVKN